MSHTRLNVAVATSFATELLTRAGADRNEAETVSKILVWSDQAGRHTQGLWRLPNICERVQRGVIQSPGRFSFSDAAAAVHKLDGGSGFGHYIGQLGMQRAIELGKASGVGMVVAADSNYFGPGGYYAQLAANEGMIGIALSNSFPKVAAFGGTKPKLGTNPFAFAAPRENGDSILLDMATSQSSGSAVRKSAELNKPVPGDVGIDKQGEPTTDSGGLSGGCLLPMAGPKGFGLALMVEILAGVISGAGTGSGVHSTIKDFERSGKNGHFFLAIDIASLMPLPDYYQRIEWLASYLTDDEASSVRLPGEIRFASLRESLVDGIELDDATVNGLEALAKTVQVSCPWNAN